MHKTILLLITLLITQLVSSQEHVPFDPNSFNQKYLEHLIKTGIDEVRSNHQCEPLVNDSILYVASEHHAKYLSTKGMLSHFEKDLAPTKTPQLRAEYYGAKNYQVGENVLFTPYNSVVKNKKGKTLPTNTYQGIAAAMVDSWVNSPGHYKNIITKDYQITGVSVSIDIKKKRIYACQKFAKVVFRFHFEENKKMFAYSDYVPPKPITSFKGLPDQLLLDYEYPYSLKHDDPSACQSCNQIVQDPPRLNLTIERNQFILKIENSEYVQKLIRNPGDGFAVEIVEFNDYQCGNPAYYTKPSRRNGQLKLNGFTTEPKYRKALFAGYKKRKKKKEIKFIPYIFKRDSIAFYKKIGQFKTDRYSSEYYRISLGPVPKDINGLWAYNLVYIQDKQICHIDYFSNYCGQLISGSASGDFVPLTAKAPYTFKPEKKVIDFTIPFKKSESAFTKKDILPFLSSLSNYTYEIDSIKIKAYASVEGNAETNTILQHKRADNITQLIQENQQKEISVSVETATDWKSFYAEIKKNRKFKYLATKTKDEIQEELKEIKGFYMESILQKGRRGDITLYSSIPVVDKNKAFLIEKELQKLEKQLKKAKKTEQSEIMSAIENLYTHTHQLVVQGVLSPDFLANFNLPKKILSVGSFKEKFLLYGYEFEDAFSKNKLWTDNKIKGLDSLYNSLNTEEKKALSPEFLYQLARIRLLDLDKNYNLTTIQSILNLLGKNKILYTTNKTAQVGIDKMNYSLNIKLINQLYKNNPIKFSSEASKSISQIISYYNKYNLMNESLALALAKNEVYFLNVNNAINLLSPYSQNKEIITYLSSLSYQHISAPYASAFYAHLLELVSKFGNHTWCNLYLNHCTIPFQAFDHEALRNEFCQKCMNENKIIKKMKGE